MKGIRVKISWDGGLYVDGARLKPAGLRPFFEKARQENAVLVLHREGVGRPPSEEQRQAMELLKDSGLELVDPVDAPSEWGPLQSFELEVTPDRFRLSAERGGDMLFAYLPDGGDKPLVYRFKGVGDAALQNLELLVSGNRVVETKPHEPDRAFDRETLAGKALHLRLSFGPRKSWQGWYEEAATPSNLENLFIGCRSLGLHVVKASVDEAGKPQEGNA
jgi:hypothetical protein